MVTETCTDPSHRTREPYSSTLVLELPAVTATPLEIRVEIKNVFTCLSVCCRNKVRDPAAAPSLS